MSSEDRIKKIVKIITVKRLKEELNLKPNAITNWYKQEVPVRYIPTVIELLKEKGIYAIPEHLNSNLKFKDIYKDYFENKN